MGKREAIENYNKYQLRPNSKIYSVITKEGYVGLYDRYSKLQFDTRALDIIKTNGSMRINRIVKELKADYEESFPTLQFPEDMIGNHLSQGKTRYVFERV